ncbi:MAG: adenine nucleotide alpha hydrolase [Acidobacteria bacterium]|nr:adenine nucleotide alpha hydrolase [Acidobacteriota bacterium]
MKILVSWSTGKDSAWMLHRLREQAPGTAAALLTTVSEAFDRVAMHGVRTSVLRAQANAAGLPLMTITIPSPCTNEVYDGRMAAAVQQALGDGFTHVAFGDLFLEDIRKYREDRLRGSGLEPLFPLWGEPTGRLAREMIAGGLEARLTCVDPRVVDPALAGRRFDDTLLADLPPTVDPCGERGEFHTCALAGPMFSRRIHAEVGEVVERDGFVFADLAWSVSVRPQIRPARAAGSIPSRRTRS